MGYHTREFKKGVYGEFSKVVEEWEELLDARLQDGKILELCELADLYGAIDGYVKAKYNMTIEDVAVMSRMTSSAFEEGTRVATIVVDDLEAEEAKLQRGEVNGVCGWCRNTGQVGPCGDSYCCPCGRGDK